MARSGICGSEPGRGLLPGVVRAWVSLCALLSAPLTGPLALPLSASMLTAVVLSASASAQGTQPHDEKKFDAAIDEAYAAWKGREWAKAKEAYERGLKVSADWFNLHRIQLAYVCLKLEDATKGLEQLERFELYEQARGNRKWAETEAADPGDASTPLKYAEVKKQLEALKKGDNSPPPPPPPPPKAEPPVPPSPQDVARARRFTVFQIDELLPKFKADRSRQTADLIWLYLRPMLVDPLLSDLEVWTRVGAFAAEVGENGPVIDRELAGVAGEALRRLGTTDEHMRLAARLSILAGNGVLDRVLDLRARHTGTFEAAARGEVPAQMQLAALFDPERTAWTQAPVVRHPEGVRHWLEKAAERDHPPALRELAVRLMGGWGIEADHARAVALAERGMALGDLNARHMVANAYQSKLGAETTRDAALRQELRQRSDAGNLAATYHLGLMLSTGRGGAEDDERAFALFQRGTLAGHAWSMVSLGFMYQYGLGVAKDEAEAVKWYRKAAEQGNAKGQSNLGAMYANGLGVAKDEAKGAKWQQASERVKNGEAYQTVLKELGLP